MMVRLLAFTALISIFTTFGIIFILGEESFQFFRVVPLRDFFLNAEWAPLFEPRSFGIWPLVNGT
ncbi:MAG: phosphate ABC transporter permease subunit PstC, partial [Bdellovibrionota bacterium]